MGKMTKKLAQENKKGTKNKVEKSIRSNTSCTFQVPSQINKRQMNPPTKSSNKLSRGGLFLGCQTIEKAQPRIPNEKQCFPNTHINIHKKEN